MKYKRNKIIFLVVYLAYTSVYIARVNLSIAGTELIAQDIVNTAQLGILGSVFSTVYAMGRLLNGELSDRKPPWFMITVGLGLAGISNILFSFFPPFVGIALLWMTNAYAQSMLWSSILCVVSTIYDKEEAKKKCSLMVTSVATGNVLAIVVNTFLITKLGVAFAFVVPGIMTIILGIVVFCLIKEIEPLQKEDKEHLSVVQLLKNKELSIMVMPALLHGMMKDNISLWMAVYIVDAYNVDLTTSAYYILLIPTIGFIGRMLYPLCYAMMKQNEHRVSLLGFVACVAFSVLLCFKPNIVIAVLCLGLIYAAVSMINTSMLSIYPLHFFKTGNVASVSGIMDFATYLGAGIGSIIYGVVIEKMGYMPMFLSWAVISIISVFIIWIVVFRKK